MTISRRLIGGGSGNSLLFSTDTFIQLPSGHLDSSKYNQFEYLIKPTAFIPSDAQVWGTNSGNSFHKLTDNGDGSSCWRNGAGQNYDDWFWQLNTEYSLIEYHNFATTRSRIELVIAGGGSGIYDIGTTGVDDGPWRIGGGFVGVIKDFKYYDENGILLNHWPIDDGVPNGGTIVDIVGGLNGTLTLGSGSWNE